MPRTVFYSWQSDIDNKYNRNFIQDCLKKAIKKLNKDNHIVEPERDTIELDSDTKNIPGIPNIVDTIFNKIGNADIFVADVTFIATSNTHRFISNPNVLIEIGYALKTLGSNRIILVLNSKYGKAEELPFDLAHRRWPICYYFDGNNKTTVEAKLIKSLEDAIKSIFKSIDKGEDITSLLPQLSQNPAQEIIHKIILASDPKEDWFFVDDKGRNYMSIFKHDIYLRFVNYLEGGVHNENFKEPWANAFPHPHATSYYYDLEYNKNLIHRFILVSVNEGKAYLPLPNPFTNEVDQLDYKIAEILTQNDDYFGLYYSMNVSGFKIKTVDK